MRKLFRCGIMLGFSLLILPRGSLADAVTLGSLSYDTSIPAGPLGPGVDAVDILNLTAGGDFLDANGVLSTVTFENLMVSINGAAAEALGSLAPGDVSLFPAILLSPDDVITSIMLAGTVDRTGVLNGNGALVELPSSFSVTLDNPDNSPLIVDESLIPITVQTVGTPEPSTAILIGIGFLFAMVFASKRHPTRAA